MELEKKIIRERKTKMEEKRREKISQWHTTDHMAAISFLHAWYSGESSHLRYSWPSEKSLCRSHIWDLKVETCITLSWTTHTVNDIDYLLIHEGIRWLSPLNGFYEPFKCGSTWHQESWASHFLHEQPEPEVESHELLLEGSIHIYLFPQWGEGARTCYRSKCEAWWCDMLHCAAT